jgi:hypothetical protein
MCVHMCVPSCVCPHVCVCVCVYVCVSDTSSALLNPLQDKGLDYKYNKQNRLTCHKQLFRQLLLFYEKLSLLLMRIKRLA